jgi:hypothetical protein
MGEQFDEVATLIGGGVLNVLSYYADCQSSWGP